MEVCNKINIKMMYRKIHYVSFNYDDFLFTKSHLHKNSIILSFYHHHIEKLWIIILRCGLLLCWLYFSSQFLKAYAQHSLHTYHCVPCMMHAWLNKFKKSPALRQFDDEVPFFPPLLLVGWGSSLFDPSLIARAVQNSHWLKQIH